MEANGDFVAGSDRGPSGQASGSVLAVEEPCVRRVQTCLWTAASLTRRLFLDLLTNPYVLTHCFFFLSA